MLRIRLQRTGRINQPSFRVVVTEQARSTKTGSIVEKVGTYNPTTKERNLNADRIKYWLSVGAKATDTVHNMLLAAGIITGKKINVLPRKSPPKKEEEAAGEGAAPAATPEAAAPAAEAPAEAPAAEEKPAEEAPKAEEKPAEEPTAAGEAKQE